MKTFNNRRKIYSSNNRRTNGSPRGAADSPYLPQKGNNISGFRRSNKNFKDQYADYINKAKDAIGNGDEILEQFYLQHAEHCFRQMEDTGRTFVAKKSFDNSKVEEEASKQLKKDSKENKIKIDPKTDFDDLANQLS